MVYHEQKQHGSQLALYQQAQRSFLQSPKSFFDYMQWRLYDARWGYYQSDRLGKDFFTTPMKSDALTYTLWKKAASLTSCSFKNWMEIGPGRLELSYAMLNFFQAQNMLIEKIILVERSSILQQWQKQHIAKHWPASWVEKVEMHSGLDRDFPDTFCMGHEVLDAMPVSRICYEKGHWYELDVHALGDDLVLRKSGAALKPECSWDDGLYQEGSMYEVCSQVAPWLENLLKHLPRSVMMWVDYGDDADHIYHPDRPYGTLRAYYEGQIVDWHHPCADLTSDVNWSQVGSIIKPFAHSISLERQSVLMAQTLFEGMDHGGRIDACHRYFFDPMQMDRRIQVMTAVLN